jgi:alpha,alpha-trehalose phosphorylase
VNHYPPPDGLPTHRFPVEPWRLVETEYNDDDLGHTETIFALGNGYIGMRGNPEEGRNAHSHGTYVNGFHETWEIQHAEDAYGFAKTGQTIVNVPDAKLMKLYVDDEPLLLETADLPEYERAVDFRRGVLTRKLLWRTPAGRLVRVESTRMVSFVYRHLAMMTIEVTPLDASAPVVVSSQLMNRQDGADEYHVRAAALGEGKDPRRARKFSERVLEPKLASRDDGSVLLGYRCNNSEMTLTAGYWNHVEAECDVQIDTTLDDDLAKTTISAHPEAGETVRITKFVTYHTSRGVPPVELAERCSRTLARAAEEGPARLLDEQTEWLDGFWERADIELRGDDAIQQALRWNLFQLAQATARTHEQGVAAKAVTAGGYDGHYFWDTEVYVVPFLAYTDPEAARKMIRFRWSMLDAARRRASMLDENGALYPWRTINGEEASAYYAAGTAQYHINAAVVFALHRYLEATGDVDFLAREGAEILIETARLWADLGFWSTNGKKTFHIHRVTGPDEYTTVVNDNTYTNVMARFNLRYASRSLRFLAGWDEAKFGRVQRATGLDLAELDVWDAAADAMYIPFDKAQQIHPQDSTFLELKPWDWDGTPDDKYPLLLHYHPLVIYRHQVLKQADVVLATFLRSEHFTVEQIRRNFDYYDPITTGDSSLSACVQSIVAAMVGYEELAVDYFKRALYLDLCDSHGNTVDGVHIASAGGVWAGIVNGFAGMTEHGDWIEFDPRLPALWDSITFRLTRHGSRIRIDLDHDGCLLTLEDGIGVPVRVGGETEVVSDGHPVRVPTCSPTKG